MESFINWVLPPPPLTKYFNFFYSSVKSEGRREVGGSGRGNVSNMDGICLVCMLCSAKKPAVGADRRKALYLHPCGPGRGETLWHKQKLLCLVKQLKVQKSMQILE